MNVSTSANRRRLLAAFSLIALGILFMTNPVSHLVYRGMKETVTTIALRGFVAPFHMALLVGSVLGITQLLRGKADRLGLVGGTLVVMGWAVGIRILGLGQLESLLESGVTKVPADTLTKMFEAAPIIWVSLVPMGILFPIGLITLGLTILVTAPIPRTVGALLAIGGVLFPIGRIPGIPWALVSCDLILGAALALIGWQLVKRTELWEA